VRLSNTSASHPLRSATFVPFRTSFIVIAILYISFWV